ncbi:MAG: hypothetical protein IKO53_07480 [Lachnospiraceae bacterium]|nr:hypothetical protein [Lachnospiraceae bacterium]
MKKTLNTVILTIFMMCMLCACGSKVDENGNALITSDWELVEYTVNGTRTVTAETEWYVKLFTIGMEPEFSTKDGSTCTFSVGGKSHNGTITFDGSEYTIDYDDSQKDMFATIDGDELRIYTANGKLEFIFEAK